MDDIKVDIHTQYSIDHLAYQACIVIQYSTEDETKRLTGLRQDLLKADIRDLIHKVSKL